MPQAAVYLSISTWTVREWIGAGVLPTVSFRVPTRRGAPFKRVLVDIRDLDALIDQSKERHDHP